MTIRWWRGRKGLRVVNTILTYMLIDGLTQPSNNWVLAQIVPDGTLNNEGSVVELQEQSTVVIEGGATRGGNLFHSFSEFNVGSEQQVYFNNPPAIENILSRVTGNNPSHILGKLGVWGNANLFLLNPNGILFGSNASLNIQGSFIATTANGLIFNNGFTFDTVNPQAPPLLTINAPIGLQFGVVPGKIENYSRAIGKQNQIVGLELQPNQTLGLIGGEVTIAGGYLTVPSGQIELGSVAPSSTVSLVSLNPGFTLEYEGVENFQDINLSNQARVDVGGIRGSELAGGGGQIHIQARNLRLTEGSQILSTTFDQPGGSIIVKTSESVQLLGSTGIDGPFDPFLLNAIGLKIPLKSSISTSSFGSGSSGDITIETQEFQLLDGAELIAETFGSRETQTVQGKGGNILIQASKFVEVGGEALIPEGQNLLSTFIIPFGLNERFFIEINATSSLSTASASFGGAAGNLRVETQRLIVRDGGIISTNPFASSDGGRLDILATDFLTVTGNSISRIVPSTITSTAFGTGDAGNITIQTNHLRIENGGVIGASTLSEGNGGNLTIIATDKVELRDSLPFFNLATSNLTVSSTGAGKAGDLTLITDRLIIEDGGGITVSGTSTGSAGNLSIQANSIVLDNGQILAESQVGRGGNIYIQAKDLLLLRNNSSITTNATGTANGGNITLDANLILALPNENSDITANANQGQGGNINITAAGIFGIIPRDQITPLSDITASSDFGVEGNIQINRPDVNPQQGFYELPENVVDVASLISQNACIAGQGSEFIITRRGGLPNPSDTALSPQGAWEDWRLIESDYQPFPSTPTQPQEEKSSPQPEKIVEAQGWYIASDGTIILTAQSGAVAPQIAQFPDPKCQ